MGQDGLKVGVKIMMKYVIKPARICCRSVYDHPFLVGILLMLLSLYRSFPFLFQLLVSASPVIVCTAVLLGTLLSFGDNNISTLIEDDEKNTPEISELRTDLVESRTVAAKSLSEDSEYTELKSEIVERSFDEEPLLDIVDREGKYERYHASREIEFEKDSINEMIERSFEEEPLLDIANREEKSETHGDVVVNSMPIDYISREIEFGTHPTGEGIDEFMDFGDQKTGIEVDVGSSHEIFEESEKVHTENFDVFRSPEESHDIQTRGHLDSFVESERHEVDVGSSNEMFEESEKVHTENLEVFRSPEESLDIQTRGHLDSFVESERQVEDVPRDVKDDSFEYQEKSEKSTETPVSDRLESSSGSWTQFEDRLSSVKKIQVDNFEDYISGEGSIDAQLGSPLELSLGSWNHLDSDRDVDDESFYGSDGAESSSPDASLADIIPMLDELHPLLEDENPQTVNLSCHDSYHSNDESDHEEEEEEVGDVKSDGDDENEEETPNGKEDRAKSVINWTEEDQKNLMELGTSELERNQRLESLILRRRARRMVSERNLLDLEGMDLSFPIPPISTTRYNPFDNNHDSYGDFGLPPIPGSAPSIMVKRQNPFDLPYDSSEEKPDLTGDSFQEEFMELGQRESVNQKLFKRNETFSAGSSIFDFGRQVNRASRFRPYFVPERTDDVMSYSSFERQLSEISESMISNSSFQRQSSELSESKASSGTDTDIMYTTGDHVEEKLFEHGSHGSEDERSLSDEGNDPKDVGHNLPVSELIEVQHSPSATSYTSEVEQPAEVREDNKGNDLEVQFGQSEREISSSEVRLVGELVETNYSSSRSLSVLKEYDGPKDEDDDRGLVGDQSHNLENVEIPTDKSRKELEFRFGSEVDEKQPKEPIYDSSPLGIKRNTSSSSICSDLQREASEIDLYHVQRDLFAEDEAQIHDKDDTHVSKDSSAIGLLDKKLLDDELPPDEVEVITKGDNVDTLDGHHASNLDASLVDMSIEYGNKSSVDLRAPLQGNQIDIVGDHVSSVDSKLSSSEVELKEGAETVVGGTEHFLASTSSVKDHDNAANKDLLFALDEAHFLPHDREKQVQPTDHINIEELGQVNEDDQTANVLRVQEPDDNMLSSLLQNGESSSQLEKLKETPFSELADETKEQDIYETQFGHVVEEHNNSIQGLDEFVADDLIMTEEITDTDMKEMDEDLLSELDAVGDFSVKNISLNLNKSYLSDDEVSSDNTQEEVDEVHFSSGIQFGDNTSVVDMTDVQTFDSIGVSSEPKLQSSKDMIVNEEVTKESAEELQSFLSEKSVQTEGIVVNEPILAWNKESIPDLHVRDASIDNLFLEKQSVENEDVAFKKIIEEGVQKSLPSEPEAVSLVETTLNDKELGSETSEYNLALTEERILDSSKIDPESMTSVDTGISDLSDLNVGLVAVKDQCVEDIDTALTEVTKEEVQEPMSQVTEEISLIETTLENKESVPDSSESKPAFWEGHILESFRKKFESGISANMEISEMSSKHFEGLETDTETSIGVEALETTIEPRSGSDESLPLRIDIDISDLQDSPVTDGDQIERSGSVDLKLLQPDIADSPVLEACTSNSPESGHEIERDVEETHELTALDASIAPSVESQVLTLNVGSNEVHASLVEGSSDSECELERDGFMEPETLAPVVEANVSCDDVSEDQFQKDVQVETEQSKVISDSKEIQELPVVEASVVCTSEAKHDNDINSQQKPEVADSKSEESRSVEKDPGSEGSKLNAPEKPTSSQVQEERSHDSHLEFSSSSSDED